MGCISYADPFLAPPLHTFPEVAVAMKSRPKLKAWLDTLPGRPSAEFVAAPR
ncbi:MAG: hypothetical protein AB8I08_07225 [Sandaracinaceae bacterium]